MGEFIEFNLKLSAHQVTYQSLLEFNLRSGKFYVNVHLLKHC